MPSKLLNCTICPKKPRFSDVSHLLTHVGSKGHLAHLHRLQVKSHQELDAGHTLAIYNQWFQEHGVAGLLSERMQQKEHKQADKKAANQARLGTANLSGKSRGRKSTATTQRPPAISAYEPQPPQLKTSPSEEDFGDLDHTPVRAPRRSNYPVLGSSPPKMLPSQSVEDEEDCPAEADAPAKASPGTPQLKGIQWPGMHLFDAAPEELKKKRNQKKDASVLRSLQRNAGRVEPTETVQSAAGIVLKRRHMDDIENDSPVEGEFVVEKPSPKRRKLSAPRAKRQPKKEKVEKAKKPRGRPRKNLQTPSKRPSSSIGDLVRSTSRFSPTEDESREFKLAVRSIGQKKKANFAIYQDSSPSFGGDGSSEMVPATYADAIRPQLPYSLPPWQRQQPASYDPFKLTRDRFSGYPAFTDIGQGKENSPILSRDVDGHATVNPLFSQAGMDRYAVAGSLSNQNRLNPAIAPNLDPFNDNDTFMPVRNPLMAALGRLNETPTKQESFGFSTAGTSNFATPYRQPLFAP
ncbi:hypothetical protein PMZ80_004066 [Knufia obscura]|uniref:Uncharacterized protein n=1 Tax=Knufia obscura TaxID=1635080 RepID=A0ABR0RR39_9EURO|nr:hypothetical protein PMZ80_004066 [Knufia obscura]